MNQAKFRYSATDGLLELEGSEEFVSKHFESLTDIVRVMSRHATADAKHERTPASSEQSDTSGSAIGESRPEEFGAETVESIHRYPTVFSEINGKLKIVADMPGANRKQQMTNAALLYCYGSELLGDEQVTSRAIRDICEEHGCIDEGNFSKTFNDKTLFLIDGVKGGTKQVKLTYTGKKRARELLSNG